MSGGEPGGRSGGRPQIGVLTGASGRIGIACAAALAGSVDRMLLVGRDRARLAEAAAEAPETALPLPVDLAAAEAAQEVATAVRAEDGDIRWVVHAAGVALRAGISEADPADIARIVAVNLTAPLLLVRELLTLPWARPASIVLVGSLSASRPLPGRSVYGAAKAGLEGAVRGLAVELAPRGIQVNAVSPGVVDTAMIAPVRPAVAAWAEQRVPAGRIGRPEEVADLIRYLCVDAPAYLTGARIPIDGGAEAAP